MRVWMLVGLLATIASAEVLVETDFGAATTPVEIRSADGRTDVTGALPDGWVENSTGDWQPDIAIRYEPAEAAERRFMRVTQTRGGNLQLAHALPEFAAPAYYRLTLTARTEAAGSPQFCIRYESSPYSIVWQVTPGLTAGWRDYRYDFELGAQPQRVRLQLMQSNRGVFDLQRVSLERLTRDEIIAGIRAAQPTADRGNLATVTRFPLGLPAGWALSREDDDAQIAITSDATVPGPSGYPALHVAAPGNFRLRSAPFAVPWSFTTHTASLSLRSAEPGSLQVIGAAGKVLARRAYAGQAGWQRLALPFEPVLRGSVHGLQIDGAGEVWLDSLQVEQGEVATAWQPAQPVEVVLASPAGVTGVPGVEFEDEPARVAWAVTGAAAARLRLSVTNLYGQTADLPPVALTGEGLRQGTVDWAGAATPRYGTFRVTAQVEDAAGQPLGAPGEAIVNRLRRPRHWGEDAPASPFGVHTLPATRHLQMAKAIGANWVRLHDAGMQYIGWSWLEPERGEWTFFDAEIDRYRAAHLSILGQLETAPYWATGYPKPCSTYWDRWYEPQNLADWSHYVETVARRYRDRIRDWEVWNEPWGSFWALYDPDGKPNQRRRNPEAAASYARLQAAAWEAVKAVDPDLTVVGFNSYAGGNGEKWTADLVADGALATCDVFSWHHYTPAQLGEAGDDVLVNGLRRSAGPIVEAAGPLDRPAWMSEGTTLRTSTFDGFYEATLPYENQDDWRLTSDSVVRYLLSTLASGAAKAFLYTMHSIDYFRGSQSPSWRVLLSNDGSLHPSAAAYSALTWQLEDTRFDRLVELAPGVTAYLFAGAGRAVAALVPMPNHAPYTVPGTAPLLDLFGNPAPARTLDAITWLAGPSVEALLADLGAAPPAG